MSALFQGYVMTAAVLGLSAYTLLTTTRRRAATNRGAQHGSSPSAAYIEIVEKGRATDDTLAGSLVVPNDVRINGVSLAVPEDRPIVVHEMVYDKQAGEAVACVTLTLFARRVTIAAESDLTDG